MLFDMRRYILVTLILFCFTCVMRAQDYRVLSVEHLPNDMSARKEIKTDEKNRQCALLRIATKDITPQQRTGFFFECDWASWVVERRLVDGEIWVWVSPGLATLKIKHQELGSYELQMATTGVGNIESLHVYKILVQGTFQPGHEPGHQPVVTQQFLVFDVTPKDAIVIVDGIPWPVTDGVAQKMVDFGKYEYRIEASDYHEVSGSVEVNDPDNKVMMPVTLKPAFGFLKIEGDSKILGTASVYIDNANGAEALKSPVKMGSGQHTVRVIHPKYKPYEHTVTIKDDETYTLKVDLNANYATLTLKVDDDAEIWVNEEKKGVRSWTGDLESGKYLIECRKEGHRSTTLNKTVTEDMSGQTITLQAPTPINGTLVVSSIPPMAKILIDGKKVGETPMRINAILIGEHTLRLEKQGCAPLSKTITIEEGKTLNLEERLDTGRDILVKTDRTGDKVYVDGDYVGETPYNTPLGFGTHTIRVVRNGVKQEKTVEVTVETMSSSSLIFEFGRLVTISTDQDGDVVMVDGERVGVSPVEVDLPFGSHVIHAERGKKYDDKDIVVERQGGENAYRLILHGESVSHFVERGVNFVTLDAAYSMAPQFSFGATCGAVKRVGWFVTAASNFAFEALKYDQSTDSEGLVEGYYPHYSGASHSTRFSLMGGMLVRVAGPFCLRLGAGYGARYKSWETVDGHLVKMTSDSYAGVDAMAGVQLNLKGFTLSVDAVTTNFQTLELKLGLGYCWKR